MPRVDAEAFQPHIRDHGADAERLAGEFDVQRVAHIALTAVHADQVADPQGLFAIRTHHVSGHALRVLLESRQFTTEMRTLPEFREALAQHHLGQELRHHEREEIGLVGRGRVFFDHRRVLVAAVFAIFALRRIGSAHRHHPIDDAEVLEYFLGARLDAFAARSRERDRQLVDQAKRDVAAGQIDGQGQSCRPGAGDENLGGEWVFHRRTPALPDIMCIIHIIFPAHH
jgi:hypothetical protein